MASIIEIEGIGSEYKKKLAVAGIKTTEGLLKRGATPKGRKEIEEKTGIGHKLILEWVNLSDLFRVKGIGEQYSDLLEEAGVDTVVELSNRNAENLYTKVIEINNSKRLVRKPPALTMIKAWIQQAKKLNRVVQY